MNPGITISSVIILSALALLLLPMLGIYIPLKGKSPRFQLVTTYLLTTQFSSLILSLRLAGGDTARYSDLYYLCSQHNFLLLQSFIDVISYGLCYLASVLQLHQLSLATHCYIAFNCLFIPPIASRKLRQICSNNFYRYFPALSALFLVLGYFMSPMRQAAASALIAYAFLARSRSLAVCSLGLHWSSIFILPIYYIIARLPGYKQQLSNLYALRLKKSIVVYIVTTILAFLVVGFLIPDSLTKLTRYFEKFISIAQNFDVNSGKLASISLSKFLVLVAVALIGFFFVATRNTIPLFFKSMIIFSLLIYPFSELARISLPGVIIMLYFLACHRLYVSEPMLKSLYGLILLLVLWKNTQAINLDYANKQAGWLNPKEFRGYANAYEIRDFY